MGVYGGKKGLTWRGTAWGRAQGCGAGREGQTARISCACTNSSMSWRPVTAGCGGEGGQVTVRRHEVLRLRHEQDGAAEGCGPGVRLDAATGQERNVERVRGCVCVCVCVLRRGRRRRRRGAGEKARGEPKGRGTRTSEGGAGTQGRGRGRQQQGGGGGVVGRGGGCEAEGPHRPVRRR